MAQSRSLDEIVASLKATPLNKQDYLLDELGKTIKSSWTLPEKNMVEAITFYAVARAATGDTKKCKEVLEYAIENWPGQTLPEMILEKISNNGEVLQDEATILYAVLMFGDDDPPSQQVRPEIDVGEARIKVISKEDGWVNFSYQIPIRNRSASKRSVSVNLQLLDAEGFAQDETLVTENIPANSTEKITGTSMMEAEAWHKVKSSKTVFLFSVESSKLN